MIDNKCLEILKKHAANPDKQDLYAKRSDVTAEIKLLEQYGYIYATFGTGGLVAASEISKKGIDYLNEIAT
jgi:hypothetical protein